MTIIETGEPQVESTWEQEPADEAQIREIADRILRYVRPLIEEARSGFVNRARENIPAGEEPSSDRDLIDRLRDSALQPDGTKSFLSANISGFQLLENIADKIENYLSGNVNTRSVDYHCMARVLRGIERHDLKSRQIYEGDIGEDLRAVRGLAEKYQK